MSLLFFEGFDGYDAAADFTNYGGWDVCTFAPNATVRDGSGKSAQISTSQSYFHFADQTANTLYFGLAMYFTQITILTPIFWFGDVGVLQNALYITTDRKLAAYRGTTQIAIGTTNIALNTWYIVEIKLKVDNSVGIFDCRLNQASEFTFSGDTLHTSGTLNRLTFQSAGNGYTAYIDDMYLCNDSGSLNNTYLGEVRAEIIYPNADSSIQFTRNTGTTNYEAVDDILGAPDDGTTNVASSTVAHKDEYGLQDLSNLSSVAGVKVNTRAQKDDTGTRSLKTGIKSGATDQQVDHSLTQGYTNFIDIFETSDGASTAFTQATINSLLSTIEVSA